MEGFTAPFGGESIIPQGSKELLEQAALPPEDEFRLTMSREERDRMVLEIIQPTVNYERLSESQKLELQEFRLGRSLLATGTFARRHHTDRPLLRRVPKHLRHKLRHLIRDQRVKAIGWIEDTAHWTVKNTLSVWRIITPPLIATSRKRWSEAEEKEAGERDWLIGLMRTACDQSSYFRTPWYLEEFDIESPESWAAPPKPENCSVLVFNATWDPNESNRLLEEAEADNGENFDE